MYSAEKKDFLCEGKDAVFLKQLHVDFISDRDKEILCDIGIPATAEPSIWFYGEEKFGGYSLKDEACKLKSLSEKRIETDGSLLDGFCIIGFCDLGGSIVIDKQGRVWTIICFENEGELKTFVNNTLDEFLDCLYEYRKLINPISRKHGNNTDVISIASKEEIKQIEEKLLSVNSEVLNEGSFWNEVISEFKKVKEEELIEYVKPILKSLGFKKKAKKWIKVTEYFTYIFYIQRDYLDKHNYFVRPGIIINYIENKPTLVCGHFYTEIPVTTKKAILAEALAFFSKWTSVEYLKESVSTFAEWNKKRKAGLLDYNVDPVPEDLFYELSAEAIEEILNIEV